jgi:hypothetical protein
LLSYDSFTRSKVPRTFEKTRNAYMLIYQRKVPQPVVSVSGLAADNPASTAVTAQETQSLQSGHGCSKLLEHVWEDNVRFLHEKKLFDPAYFSFLWHLTDLNSSSALPGTTLACFFHLECATGRKSTNTVACHVVNVHTGLALKTVQVATFFFLEVISHAKDREILPRFGDRLRQRYGHLRLRRASHSSLSPDTQSTYRYKESQEACRWLAKLLIDDKRMLSQLLLECPVEEVRANLHRPRS